MCQSYSLQRVGDVSKYVLLPLEATKSHMMES